MTSDGCKAGGVYRAREGEGHVCLSFSVLTSDLPAELLMLLLFPQVLPGLLFPESSALLAFNDLCTRIPGAF